MKRAVELNALRSCAADRVKPELVCEIGFEAIQASARHKAGIAVRFPRILRVRSDKNIDQADSLQRLHGLLKNDR